MLDRALLMLTTLLLLSTLLEASFSGKIIDAKSALPIANAIVNGLHESSKSDENGTFIIKSNDSVYNIKAYGYRPYHLTVDSNQTLIKLEPVHVKALYLTFWGASNNSKTFQKILNIIDKTNANAVVVDVKNEYGSTLYWTSFQQANEYGAYEKRTNRNIKKFMQTLKDRDIYTIARIVTFKDELQASNNPDYAIKKADGTIWRNHDNMAWVDPFDIRSHNYALGIAEEAAKVGFDEINFDYIRFPAKTGLKLKKENNIKNRIQAISDFLILAQKKLKKYGVFISVDTYGNICWAKDDNGIGQTVTSLAKYADYLCPMLYPSGFSSGSFHFKYPAKHPYSVIRRSITNIKDRIDPMRVRPWLQYFKDYTRARQDYRKFEIQEQIRATKATKTNGWMMWSPSSQYHLIYFLEE